MGILGKHVKRFVPCTIISFSALCGAKASADVFNMPSGQTSLQFVTVGDPGNAPDTNGLGSVPYNFQMGECDITSGEYTQFLNAVASTDPYALYDPSMNPDNGFGSCAIVRSGSSGNFTYSVAGAYANFPVNEVSWGDAARFCNWLTNGQPTTGVENAASTETGSYALNGAVTDQELAAVTRSPTAKYVIPTENEWYKAAFYKGKSANAGYWLFATQSDAPPSNLLSAIGTDNANFFDPRNGFTNPGYGLTPVGSFADSPSAYGTYDQSGNVYQWNEDVLEGGRAFEGGAFSDSYSDLESGYVLSSSPTAYEALLGFRVAEVPEPSSLGLLAIGAFGLMRRRRNRR